MKKLLLLLIPFFLNCSSDETPASSDTDIVPQEYLKFTVDDASTSFLSKRNEDKTFDVAVFKDAIIIYLDIYRPYKTIARLIFNRQGEFVEGNLAINGYGYGENVGYNYQSFIPFSKNYFTANIIELNEKEKRINMVFNGRLYLNQNDITSYSRGIAGELKASFDSTDKNFYTIKMGEIEQYCRATFNNAPWIAKFERKPSVFTNEDPYKIEINIDYPSQPGSFIFDTESSVNFVKFYKFNTQTLVYEEYKVTGNLAYSYREYHGGTTYSYIGTFNLTATNPNDPSDIITVKDGSFRNIQGY